MPKDILLYGHIGQYNAMYFFDQINEATEEDAGVELQLRVNCEGGSPEYGMGIITKFQEIADQFSLVKVEAMAHSMALFLLCYVDKDKVEAIDCTQAVLHRAAYPSWFESQPSFPGSIHQEMLTKTNKDLEKAFRAKVDVSALEALPQMVEKNLKLKDIFATETRHEVLLSGADLKKIGLAGSVSKITPSKAASLQAQVKLFEKCGSLEEYKMAAQQTVPKPQAELKIESDMTPEKLKAEFPQVYAAILQTAKEEALKAEKERIAAWMAWVDVDKEAVNKAIADGAVMTMANISELSAKAAGAKAKADLNKDGEETPDVSAGGQEPTKEPTEKVKTMASFEALVDKNLGAKIS